MTAAVEMAVATHKGRVRPHNEDSLAADQPGGLAVVADGMGGHNAGEVASRLAVEVIAQGYAAAAAERAPLRDTRDAEMLLASLIERANRQVHELGRQRPDFRGMGTTVVVGLWYGRRMSVGHVGDSRLYRLRSGRLDQLTRDHTLVQEQVERGTLTPDSAREAPIRSILTRAVGSEARVAVELASFETNREDTYLLCSDGLTEMLTDSEILDVLTASDRRIQDAAEALVEQANERGGVDNISVVLVRVTSDQQRDSGGAT